MAARPALRRALPSLRSAVTTTRPEQLQLRFTRPFSTTSPSLAPNPNSPSSATPDYAIPDPSRPTHFGFQTVTEGEKRERVAGVFTGVAESYDRMNDLMSFGWHRVWKDHFVFSLNPGFSPLTDGADPREPQHILDVAGGTGDIALRLLHHAHVVNGNPAVRVTISDINRAMLTVGQQRAAASLPASQQAALSFVEANAEDLTRTRPLHPYPSSSSSSSSSSSQQQKETSQAFFDPLTATSSLPTSSIDLYTVAFGIRNFSNMAAALREAHRVLKPGGVFACLEFGKVGGGHPLLDAAYRAWSFRAIPLLGQLVAADRDSYQYLVESIARFPRQDEFRDMIVDAGFVVAGRGWEDLTGGVAAVHRGMKPRV